MLGTGLAISTESIMFFGLGLLVSALLATVAIPLVHGRAVRLTTRKLDAANPISMKDIQAEKDVMRAEFSMTARRLETSIEELRNKASAHLTELAKKSNVIAKLRQTLDERESMIATLETSRSTLDARLKTLYDELQGARSEIDAKTDALFELERMLAAVKTEAVDLKLASEHRALLLERQSVEIAALKSHIDTVRHQVADFASEVRRTEDQLAHEWVDLLRVPSPSISQVPGTAGTHAANGSDTLANGSAARSNGAKPLSNGHAHAAE